MKIYSINESEHLLTDEDNKMKVIKHEFTSEELNKRLTMSDAALFTCLTQNEYLNLWHTNSLPTLEVALKFYPKGKK